MWNTTTYLELLLEGILDKFVLLLLIHPWKPKFFPSLVLCLLVLVEGVCQAASPPLEEYSDKDYEPEHAVREEGNEGWLALHTKSSSELILVIDSWQTDALGR